MVWDVGLLSMRCIMLLLFALYIVRTMAIVMVAIRDLYYERGLRKNGKWLLQRARWHAPYRPLSQPPKNL